MHTNTCISVSYIYIWLVDSSFLLGNARVVDHPIVFANDGFCKISGYSRAEIMQQSSMLRFLWSDNTDESVCDQMHEAFENQKMLQVQISVLKKSSEFNKCYRINATAW